MGMKTKKRCAAWLFICVLCIGAFSHLFFPSGIQARADAYGDPAYQYIRYLAEHYPARIADSRQKTAAGSWIADQLRSFGYPVEELGFDQNGYHFVNYTATKQGKTDQIVYVGAHYDSVNTTGTDDNASGVAAVLEIAQRMKNVETEFTIKFCFFDGEESTLTGLGYAGSCNYTTIKKDSEAHRALCYINVDCVAAGDILYAYGGVYENGALTKTVGYDWANNAASAAGVPLSTLPQAVDMFPSPTRVTGSDQHYFNSNWGIPYVYFEASRWCEPDGSGGNSETNKTCWYQTNDSRLASTGGRVMHMPQFDSLSVLESYFPGRVHKNLSDTVTIIMTMLQNPDYRFGSGSDTGDYEINGYRTRGSYLTMIEPQTTVSALRSHFSLHGDTRLEIADPNGAVCSDTDLIRTGSRITLYSGQTPIAQYQAVIYGDMSCDGVIDIVDFAYIKSQMLGQLQMTGIQAEAADIDGTGTVDIVDFAYLKSYMLGALQIPQH